VARHPLGGNRVGLVAAVLSAIWIIYGIVQFKDWTLRVEIIAFFAGSGGVVLMFYRWRNHGDRLAKVLCLAAFGTWALACIIWPVGGAHAGEPGSPGFDAAAVALLTGFVGGIIVLVRGQHTRPR